MNRAVQTYFAYQFVKNLATDFTKWKAYKMGLIDRDGNKIRDAENSKEKEQFGLFYNLVRHAKRLLSKVPGGRTFVGSVVAAGFLLKEEYSDKLDDEFIDILIEELTKQKLIDEELLEEEFHIHELDPGVYTNIEETKDLYDGIHVFYVKESILADMSHGVPMYSLPSVLKGTKYIHPSHIRKIR